MNQSLPTGKETGKEVRTKGEQVGPCPQPSQGSYGGTEVCVSVSHSHSPSQGLRQPSAPLTSMEPTLEVTTESWSPLKEKQRWAQRMPASPEACIITSESTLGVQG